MDPKHMGQVTTIVDRSWDLSDHWPILTRLIRAVQRRHHHRCCRPRNRHR